MEIDYQAKCKSLKRKLKILLYEQESFLSELEKAQRKLLKVSRDKSFLLDRLLLYEQVTDASSEDSDATLSSDCEVEAPSQKKRNIAVPKAESNIMIKSEFHMMTEVKPTITENTAVDVDRNNEGVLPLSSAITDATVPFEPVVKNEFSQTTEPTNNEADQGASDTSLNISDVERQLSSSLVANANSSISPLDPFPTTDLPQDVFE